MLFLCHKNKNICRFEFTMSCWSFFSCKTTIYNRVQYVARSTSHFTLHTSHFTRYMSHPSLQSRSAGGMDSLYIWAWKEGSVASCSFVLWCRIHRQGLRIVSASYFDRGSRINKQLFTTKNRLISTPVKERAAALMAWSMGSIIPYVVSEASHWLIVLRIAQWPSDKGIPFLDNRLLFFHLYISAVVTLFWESTTLKRAWWGKVGGGVTLLNKQLDTKGRSLKPIFPLSHH